MRKTAPLEPNVSERLDADQTQVIERPDGFYWLDKDTNKEYGPFPTLPDAMEDMEDQSATDEYEEGESLEEAEEEIGIANWIDPDTGEPAEGVQPHLSDE